MALVVQAITTKYIGPSNKRGSRVKAECQAGSITLEWDDTLNPERNHHVAARRLAEKWGWGGDWHCGALPDGGNVYVVSRSPDDIAFSTEQEG